jgi:hypothetical protein
MSKPDQPVFRKIDGKLVPIPGNLRDPERRYHSVSSNGEVYHLEFTDEEERERDEEERRWELEKPQREAERKRQEEEAKKFRASLVYENRVVAFIDVLGWKNAIIKSNSDPEITRDLGLTLNIFRAHKDMAEWMEKNGGEGGWYGDPQVTHFSDSILVSMKAGESEETQMQKYVETQMLSYVWSITDFFLQRNFLVRGGITEGKLIHKNSIAYGPALIDAYELERDPNRYPRIILSDTISEKWVYETRVSDQEGNYIGDIKNWRIDTDGKIFYDFLQPFPNFPPIIDARMLQYRKQLDPVRKLIKSNLVKPSDSNKHELDIYKKYKWFAEYFDQITEEYPGCGEKIL